MKNEFFDTIQYLTQRDIYFIYNEMDLDHLPPLSLGFLRREHERLQYLFAVLTKYSNPTDFQLFRKIVQMENKAKSSAFSKKENPIPEDQIPSGEQTVRIATNILKVLNQFMSDKTHEEKRIPWMRKKERDENGERAFFLSHPIKVATLCFELLPEENVSSLLPTEEAKKINEVRENPYEVTITSLLHDFVEDIFYGEFDVPHPEYGKTATEIIWEILNDHSLGIPTGARKRIFDRIVILTKPPQRYASPKKELANEDAVQQYLEQYESYLQRINESNDSIAQYIKGIDIFRNAQSQKNGSSIKRAGKAKLQAAFLENTFPIFTEKLMQNRPEFFDKMSDRNLVEEVQKRIKNRVDDVLNNKTTQ